MDNGGGGGAPAEDGGGGGMFLGGGFAGPVLGGGGAAGVGDGGFPPGFAAIPITGAGAGVSGQDAVYAGSPTPTRTTKMGTRIWATVMMQKRGARARLPGGHC
uniref:Uncharacterized protein n=1 Tax=Oryza punctata TaxID=4537 RepID=A0A0E0MGU6_ORYPU